MTGPPPGAARFVLGTSSAAYRVQPGGLGEPTIWDVFASAPGRVTDGSVGPQVIDHIRYLETDLALLSALRPMAHRFSLSWSALAPSGGVPDGRALGHYDRLLDGLCAAGIDPWVCLHHWDLPASIMAEGGWLSRDTADRFADYAASAVGRYGDRVAAWITMADPWQHSMFGHGAGVDAPGLVLLAGAFDALHHQLLGHGLAVPVLRAAGPVPVGISASHAAVRPAGTRTADRRAAALFDTFINRLIADPVLRGRYPRIFQDWIDQRDVVQDNDLALINVPLDFYGVDHHPSVMVAAAPGNRTVPFSLVPSSGPVTDTGASIDPAGLSQVLTALHRRHPGAPPLVVTESGGAFDDLEPAGVASSVDQPRIDYLDTHLAATLRARSAGVDVRGYFHRSLTDGWEGADGYSARYGLIRVRPDGTRSPRASFEHFRAMRADLAESSPR